MLEPPHLELDVCSCGGLLRSSRYLACLFSCILIAEMYAGSEVQFDRDAGWRHMRFHSEREEYSAHNHHGRWKRTLHATPQHPTSRANGLHRWVSLARALGADDAVDRRSSARIEARRSVS